jgi:hypothetical protein
LEILKEDRNMADEAQPQGDAQMLQVLQIFADEHKMRT